MMVIKIMIKAFSNKIIIRISTQACNNMTGISWSSRTVMLDRSMTKDNITRNNTIKISIIIKTKYTIRLIIKTIKTLSNIKTANIMLIVKIKTIDKANLIKFINKTMKNLISLQKINLLIIKKMRIKRMKWYFLR